MVVEKWKVYKDFDGRYEISSLGRVRTTARITLNSGRRGGKPYQYKILSRIRKTALDRYGYEQLTFRGQDKKLHHRTVHRMVAEMFISGWFKGAQVNHKDGNKKNNTSSNLEWVTPKENVRHAYHVLGRKSDSGKIMAHRKKLTEENVLDIRARIVRGETMADLGRELGVHWTTISSIHHRKSWSWL